jgi:hypothetical protein
MRRAYDLHDELTDIFSGDPPTEEMPTALLTSQDRTGPLSRQPSLPSCPDEGPLARDNLLPFSWEGSAEETVPVAAAMLASRHIPSDEDAAELKALVRQVASAELRHRRPRRR